MTDAEKIKRLEFQHEIDDARNVRLLMYLKAVRADMRAWVRKIDLELAPEKPDDGSTKK